MRHLTLVPPPADVAPVTVPEQRPMNAAWEDPNVVALSFFQSASGLCLCRDCSMKRHPAYGAR
jgi:hypothetical protein